MNPILALIIANLVWGAASPIFKLALTNIPPFTLAFIRFSFAAVLFLPFIKLFWKKINFQELLEVLLVGVFGITINISFFFLGLPKTTSINAPIIASSGPIFIYLLSILFLRERPKAKILFGMLTALIGVLIIILSPIFLEGKRVDFGEIEGNIFFLIATFGTVMQTIISKDTLKKVNPYQATFISFIFGALTFFPLMIKELRIWEFSQLNNNGILGIVFGVFLSSALAYLLFYYGISKIKASEVGMFTYIDPVVAIIIAIPLLHEYPNIFFIAGSVLVFGGIFFAEGRLHWHPFHKLKSQSSNLKTTT
ncbi:MAG: hypothetical protein UR68_C0012G0002 [Candidatus Roizmanbacteria bacterium GW2011_GWA2_35_19]|uniref:EamA domain-containing protein n=2 Tax=Candidatus Roizmaniibacteriota TaxID=1752723 RepID=A0A0G0BTM7_9BACT|nr:MAG: hypothetical protein UR63_C0031G0002 [Candidatus Roizmanbacteria bacterium GW2011_GWC2_35_12]KKP72809.1 MAG: hypothetical protein UR68_C0012G0002 [Candidatus Roizmanbacteria bacterium GW2011_GWA2_35_19]